MKAEIRERGRWRGKEREGERPEVCRGTAVGGECSRGTEGGGQHAQVDGEETQRAPSQADGGRGMRHRPTERESEAWDMSQSRRVLTSVGNLHPASPLSCTNPTTPEEETEGPRILLICRRAHRAKRQELGSPGPPSCGMVGPGLPALSAVSWGVGAAVKHGIDGIEAVLEPEAAARQSITVPSKSRCYINFSSIGKSSD